MNISLLRFMAGDFLIDEPIKVGRMPSRFAGKLIILHGASKPGTGNAIEPHFVGYDLDARRFRLRLLTYGSVAGFLPRTLADSAARACRPSFEVTERTGSRGNVPRRAARLRLFARWVRLTGH
jgi:hypothetical protein